ncbi:hypothetical protein DL770_010128 [Monosporascus sp. CRB-9-2]|nr:hypothetical protein DL770_010128 [Monosporascus sp. CRB-9-2]
MNSDDPTIRALVCEACWDGIFSVHGWQTVLASGVPVDDNAAKFVKARERITDISSPESYQLALECLDNCIRTHHAQCPPPQTAAFLPDRVIDCSNVRNPKIVLTGGNQHGLYVTLSYVWGGQQPMTTTKNIDKYVTEGLQISEFPQTIQDAILVTHNIGQRYLWIDALCILQDSVQDKNRQLGQMRYIYRNAYLTINAACAKSSHEGFLHRFRPQKVPNAKIPYRCPDGMLGSIWIAEQFDTNARDASHSYWDELEPITYRGWCLQEKLLPPRSLIYASDTLKYYCQTETVNIGHALCEPSTGRRLPSAAYRPTEPNTTKPSESDRVAYRQAWLAVVFMYTFRNISVPSDRLVALAGVAEQFHLVYNDQYLAGLWRRTLLFDLLWESSSAIGRPQPRPKGYRAPSWSWASIDGLINAEYRVDELVLPPALDTALVRICQVNIIDCQVNVASEEAPFGEVTGGILKLKGLMKEVFLGESGSVLSAYPNHESKEIGYVSFDADEERQGPIHVVPALWDARGSFVMGLVLATADADQPTYKRVGRFQNRNSVADLMWLEGLCEQEIVVV